MSGGDADIIPLDVSPDISPSWTISLLFTWHRTFPVFISPPPFAGIRYKATYRYLYKTDRGRSVRLGVWVNAVFKYSLYDLGEMSEVGRKIVMNGRICLRGKISRGCHLHWLPVRTAPTPSFKVTQFFDAEYLGNGTTYRQFQWNRH